MLRVRTMSPSRMVGARDRAVRAWSDLGSPRMTVAARSRPPTNVSGSVVVSVASGLLTGSLCVLFALSYAGIVFTGPLGPFVAIGVGMALLGATVHALVLAAGSSYPGSVGGIGAETAILGVVVSTLGADPTLAASPETLLATTVAVIAVASALTGAVYWSLGRARLGNLIRYIPYPVMGGFVAGIGWLLLVGASELTLGHLGRGDLTAMLLDPTLLPRWLPALAVGAALVGLERRVGHYLGVPAVMVLTTVGFYLAALGGGLDLATLERDGWLLGPLADGRDWSPTLLAETVASARWSAVAESLPGIATFTATVVIGLLLVGASLEIVTRRDLRLNRDLEVAGISNLVAALGGGFPGYHYIGCSSLHHHMGADRRVAGTTAGVVCAVALIAGLGALEHLPRMVLAVLLFFMGFSLLLTWLVESVLRLTRTDYLIVLTVFVLVVLVGLMEAVVIGLILGIALFAFNYARLDVVKKELTATNLRSRVSRPASALGALREHGDSVSIYRLDGYIFFGTVNRLLERIRTRTEAAGHPLRCVVLDFRNVRGIDSSAAIYFSRLPSLARRRGFDLVLTAVGPALWRTLQREGLQQERRVQHTSTDIARERRARHTDDGTPRVMVFPTLDDALEWSEDRLLEDAEHDEVSATIQSMADVYWRLFEDPRTALRFMRYAQRQTFAPGETLTAQDAPFRNLYFIVRGSVNVTVVTAQGESVRLRSMGAGACIGEISMYLGTPATASVQATSPTEVIALSKADLRRIREEAPDINALLHEAIAHTLASRLAEGNRLIDVLLH